MKALIWIIVIALVIYGIYWFTMRDDSMTPLTGALPGQNATTTPGTGEATTTPGTSTTTGPGASATTTSTAKTVTITYTSAGFNPASATINKGDTVRFVNNSNGNLWVGSDEHPTHTEYDNTNLQAHCATGATPSFDSCRNLTNGQSYSFKFDKVGSWDYHNHSAATLGGTIIVR
jgi:plastocyanin